jgi:hypothetical protein
MKTRELCDYFKSEGKRSVNKLTQAYLCLVPLPRDPLGDLSLQNIYLIMELVRQSMTSPVAIMCLAILNNLLTHCLIPFYIGHGAHLFRHSTTGARQSCYLKEPPSEEAALHLEGVARH